MTARQGVYEVCISSLEADKRWRRVTEALLRALNVHWLALELPEHVASRLVELARRRGKTISDIVVEALETYLSLEVAEAKRLERKEAVRHG